MASQSLAIRERYEWNIRQEEKRAEKGKDSISPTFFFLFALFLPSLQSASLCPSHLIPSFFHTCMLFTWQVYSLAWNIGGTRLASGSEDRTASIYVLKGGRIVGLIHTCVCVCVCVCVYVCVMRVYVWHYSFFATLIPITPQSPKMWNCVVTQMP